MLMENFQVGRPVGTGRSRPNDVIRLRKALRETGHGASPPEPSGTYDASLIRSIERFQRDYGLKEDGIVLPDGPTARMLDIALAAQRQDGDEGQARLRDTVRPIIDAGLTPAAPPPDDERPIVFTDENGDVATPDRLAEIVGRARRQSPDRRPNDLLLASTTLATAEGAMHALPGAAALSPEAAAMLADLGPIGLTILGVGAVSYAADQWGKAHPDYLARMQSERDAVASSIADRTARQRARRDANGAKRTNEAPPGTTIYPGGSKPPPLPSHTGTPQPTIPRDNEPEIFPAIERRPTILISPDPGQATPQIEIFPDMSNAFERWLVYENSRGLPEGQQKDLQYVIDTYYQKRKDRGAPVEHMHGGFHAEDERYLKEAFFHQTPKMVKGGRRSDATFIEHKDGKPRQIDFNIQDMNRSRQTATKRERDALNDIIAIKARRSGDNVPLSGETVGLPKSKGIGEEEYKKLIDSKLDELIDIQLGKQ